jgi:hypothetical protein
MQPLTQQMVSEYTICRQFLVCLDQFSVVMPVSAYGGAMPVRNGVVGNMA